MRDVLAQRLVWCGRYVKADVQAGCMAYFVSGMAPSGERGRDAEPVCVLVMSERRYHRNVAKEVLQRST